MKTIAIWIAGKEKYNCRTSNLLNFQIPKVIACLSPLQHALAHRQLRAGTYCVILAIFHPLRIASTSRLAHIISGKVIIAIVIGRAGCYDT
jgi:hypothetical protein